MLKYWGISCKIFGFAFIDLQAFLPMLLAIDVVKKKFASWMFRKLSFAGRRQLIESVIFGVMVFWSSVCILPRKVIFEVEKMCQAFL